MQTCSQKVFLCGLMSAGDPAPSDRAADPVISSGDPPELSCLQLKRITGFLQEHQSRSREERRMDRLGAALAFRLLLISWLAAGPALARVRHPLPVLWMMPPGSGAGGGNRTAGIVSAVELALQDLEKQPVPLGNYQIQMQPLDSPCDPARAIKALFDTLWAGPRYLLLFGGACPPVMALLARSLPALSLVQVSFTATPPSLSNRKWYGNLWSTAPSERGVNQATIKLLQRFRWRRVGVIAQEPFFEVKDDLVRQLQKVGIRLAAAEGFSEDACGGLKKLKDEDVRIIVGFFREDFASEVFCCAYRQNLFGARYQWIVAGGGAAGWRHSACAASSLQTAADGSFRVQVDTPGRTPQEYQDSYRRRLSQEGSTFHPYAYDAVWVAAKALSQAMEAVRQRERYQRNATLGEEEVVKMLLGAVKNTRFDGVTGPVLFRNGERMTTIHLIQVQGGGGVAVGEFNTSTQQLRLNNQLLRFSGSGPARDQPVLLVEQRLVSLPLYVALSSAAGGTIFITLTALLFVIINRRRWRRISGGSSQDLLLLLGLLLSSSSVPLSGLDGASLSEWTLETLCSAHLWTLSAGHAVTFAVLLIRTWRVYCQKLQKEPDWILIWVLLPDVFVLTSWQILDPLRRVELQHQSESHPADPDLITRPFSKHCGSGNMELWLTAAFGFKAPLLGLGCFLAWSIRSADAAKPLTFSMFALSALSASGVSGSLLTSHNPPLQFCLSSLLILSGSLLLLGALLGPQICVAVRGDVEVQLPSELQEEVSEEEDQLRRRNQQLKSQSAQLDVQIETISMQLSEMTEDAAGEQQTSGGSSAVKTHEVQLCALKASSFCSINSPEQVSRRLSVQLPILHHAYLPVVGGVRSSSSSLSGCQEAPALRYNNFL
ncbi:gamma-aminobutyric acid type B receptor subunit 2 isoform X2 [Oryzias melastigma]|uniref:gamma-aminobutyric acid type B receptor subunit 2 isoform X2 n=1 Tax=Oryzias melastigma TaxID=30732 RepID=UPI000CF7E9FF|nr:gamma-aminobutyric acid type B receptor subunit 2 isoform X2 [Oryzias melastigma]